MNTLTPNDLHFVVSRLPKDVVALLRDDPRLCVAGGVIRALIAQEKASDIDMFGPSADVLKATADKLAKVRTEREEKTRVHRTDNATTVFTPGRLPVQFITRWVFSDFSNVVASFDFTVCQAAIYFDPTIKAFQSQCSETFYSDLAARRIVYTAPIRNEDAGGSLLRVIKYIKRGYSIQVQSLGAVCARLYSGIRSDSQAMHDEPARAKVLAGLLREVDPLLIIDGIDISEDDEHSAPRVS